MDAETFMQENEPIWLGYGYVWRIPTTDGMVCM